MNLPDKLLINLKIISKIQKNGRITRSYDGVISLESDVLYQPLKRFLLADSRKQAIFEINSIVNEALDTITHFLNSKHLAPTNNESETFFKSCESLSILLSELEHAKMGIENLKFTYQNDPNISTQMDIILLKIQTNLRDTRQKLANLQSLIPNVHSKPFLKLPLFENPINLSEISE
ncbi:hypothetical protein EB118_02025 [bacterium]|nr:hypothetical protein [bacterium]NDC94195.1 hypothetical protein [bacterium]NDD83027.1 hypothetical protein [bacterium]NDG28865.1 hypothetical protein [bacterium]